MKYTEATALLCDPRLSGRCLRRLCRSDSRPARPPLADSGRTAGGKAHA